MKFSSQFTFSSHFSLSDLTFYFACLLRDQINYITTTLVGYYFIYFQTTRKCSPQHFVAAIPVLLCLPAYYCCPESLILHEYGKIQHTSTRFCDPMQSIREASSFARMIFTNTFAHAMRWASIHLFPA